MKDGLGQEIVPGSKVIWLSGKRQYSGVQIFEVERITDKRVKLQPQNTSLTKIGNQTYVTPTDLVVIDKLL